MTTQTMIPVGKAVYLEFVKPGMTTQVMLMPEGVTSSHKTVPFSMYRRRISTVQPRKTWRLIAGTTYAGSMMASSSAIATRPQEIGATMLGFAEPLFNSLAANSWKLRKEPIVVEVTAEDLEAVRTGKTPYKALGRVWKVRKFLGFPAEYIDPLVPASV